MQQEIDGLVDANKSLRLLLERLMETKSDAGIYLSSIFSTIRFFKKTLINIIIEAQVKETRNRILDVEEINARNVIEIERNKLIIQQYYLFLASSHRLIKYVG